MEAAVAYQIWNYIGRLGVGPDTAQDLYQEAETAVWQAVENRLTHECRAYLVKTGIGAIRHWLRDKYSLIRVPGYLYDRGKAAEYAKTIVPLNETTEKSGYCFEEELLDRMNTAHRRTQIETLLPRLTGAERTVMEMLLAGKSLSEIAGERNVHVSVPYNQRSRAINKLRKLVANGALGSQHL